MQDSGFGAGAAQLNTLLPEITSHIFTCFHSLKIAVEPLLEHISQASRLIHSVTVDFLQHF